MLTSAIASSTTGFKETSATELLVENIVAIAGDEASPSGNLLVATGVVHTRKEDVRPSPGAVNDAHRTQRSATTRRIHTAVRCVEMVGPINVAGPR